MKKLYIQGLFLLILSCFFTVKVDAQEKKDIFCIPEPTWIFNAGMSKGKYHDRQDLGFILPENAKLLIRQSNTNFKDDLTVRLLGDDSAEEKSVQVGSEWTIITASVPLVPFVDTPYGDTPAQLEYEVINYETKKTLPIYEYQMDEQDFFSTWDKSDSEYGLIKGNDFQLLIPKKDKESVRNLEDYSSLDELIEHYNDLFNFYNQMAGFDGSTPENQNGKNRYFLKADVSGIGGAYYGANWAANSYNTVDMWLTKNSWGTLHEIAHGYQAGFDGVGMYTGEVSNNLFGVQYQYAKYGKEADTIGWLFNYGEKEEVDVGLYDKMIVNKGTYDSVDLREKLLLLSLLKQKAGDDSFTKMYQEYRRLANQPNFNKNDYPLPDLMNQVYSENSKQDFTPVLERWGLSVDDHQGEKNRSMGYPAVASLADVVPGSELDRARQLIDPSYLINSDFEMVTNDEISSLNLVGDLTLQLNTTDIQDLLGIKVSLKDGTKEVASQEIKNDKITFDKIPNGIYHLEFSGEKMTSYVPDDVYVYVRDTQNNVKISLNKIKVSNLVNQTFDFLGLSDSQFGTLTTNLNGQECIISITDENPHSYFAGEPYTEIIILDNNYDIKYHKDIQGTKATVGIEKPSLEVGDLLLIFHAETPGRLYSSEDIIDKSKNTNTWLVTKYGLQNQILENDPQQDLIKRIENEGNRLLQREEIVHVPLEQSSDKKQLYFAIQLLDETYKDQYMNKFSALFY